MIVRIDHEKGKHINFYEGTHVGFHPKGVTWEEGLTVVVEGRNGKDCITIEITADDKDARIFLMNDLGKTVEKIFV